MKKHIIKKEKEITIANQYFEKFLAKAKGYRLEA